MRQPTLSRIEIFPIKSLDGMVVETATVLPRGALKGDRQYAIVDPQGKWVNGKTNAAIHGLRNTFSADLSTVTLWVQNQPESTVTFNLMGDRTGLEQWLSDYFKMPTRIEVNTEMGFPDDSVSPGPTVITTATLEAIAQWFPGMRLAEARRRFRTNLELADAPAFWEDRLYGKEGEMTPFWIGAVQFFGVNPCQRCIVPTRDSCQGRATAGFQKTFVQQRRSTLPEWVERSRFNHYYRLAVNTRISEGEVSKNLLIQLGDLIHLNG
jgi:uncharacterized protein